MKREVNMRHKPEGLNANDKETIRGVETVNRATFKADKDINTDPLGMWTGVPFDDPLSPPIQDADDL